MQVDFGVGWWERVGVSLGWMVDVGLGLAIFSSWGFLNNGVLLTWLAGCYVKEGVDATLMVGVE